MMEFTLLLFQDPNAITTSTLITALLGSVVLGSIISLVGIWLQDFFQRKQQARTREMEMRREIYFLGAEALGKMQAYLVSLANPLMPDNERNALVSGVGEAINKVAMIANAEMLEELDKVQAHYAESNIKLVTQRMEFTAKANQLKADEETHANLAQHLTQLTTALTSANQQKDQNQQRTLVGQYNELARVLGTQQADLRTRRADILTEITELIGDSVEAAIKFDELAAPLNCMARAELGFPRYLGMLEAAGKRQRALAEAWRQDWNDRFKERAEESPFDATFPS